jgi:hypothetical protein
VSTGQQVDIFLFFVHVQMLPLPFFITVALSHSGLVFHFKLLTSLNHVTLLLSAVHFVHFSLLKLSVFPLSMFIFSAYISCSIQLLFNPTFLVLLTPFLSLLTCCFLCFCYHLYFLYSIPFPTPCALCFPFPSSSHCTHFFLSFFLLFHLGFLSFPLYSLHYLYIFNAHIVPPLLTAHESQ